MALNILLSRTDNLGDIVYSLPLVALLKQHYSNARVTLLARGYAKSLIDCYPTIDGMINWDELKTLSASEQQRTLSPFDIFINVLACRETAKLAYEAGIKTRIGTFGRWYHWRFCNRLVLLTRAKSKQHEIRLNTKLLRPLNIKVKANNQHLQSLIKLHTQTQALAKKYLNKDKFNLILHPASNGSGREWPTEHYISLIKSLKDYDCQILLTGGPNDTAKSLAIETACPWITNTVAKTSLSELLYLIEHSDGLIAAGTGPLHIASSMNKKTLGLFPPKHNIGPGRWAPLGQEATYLTKEDTSPCNKACSNHHCPCMSAITTEQVLHKIKDWFE